MGHQFLRNLRYGLLLAAGLTLSAAPAFATNDGAKGNSWQPNSPRQWLGTWATAGSTTGPFDAPVSPLNDQTQRHTVRLSAAGKFLRVRFSNVQGTAPLTIGAASLARPRGGENIKPRSLRKLTFGGQPSITIAPGARVFSDPVRLKVAALADLTISLYVPDGGTDVESPVTNHVRALQTGYVGSGDQTGAAEFVADSNFTSIFYLTGVDVAVSPYGWPPVGIAVMGDSIANGDESTLDANNRWPNLLAQRLVGNAQGRHWRSNAGVMNLGISGNMVTKTIIGKNAQARFDGDVLAQSGVTHVIIHQGINDFGLPPFLPPVLGGGPAATPEAVISGLQQMIRRAKAKGLKVFGGTISPAGAFVLPTYGAPETEAARQKVNKWIRTSGEFDAVLDFDAVLRDPDDPTILRADLTADGLHPNDAGYAAMAKAIPLRLFRHSRRW